MNEKPWQGLSLAARGMWERLYRRRRPVVVPADVEPAVALAVVLGETAAEVRVHLPELLERGLLGHSDGELRCLTVQPLADQSALRARYHAWYAVCGSHAAVARALHRSTTLLQSFYSGRNLGPKSARALAELLDRAEKAPGEPLATDSKKAA